MPGREPSGAGSTSVLPEMVRSLSEWVEPVLAPDGGELGVSILELSLSHYWSLLLLGLPVKADLFRGLDLKSSCSEVWLLHALLPGLTQSSDRESVLVRHHRGASLWEPVLCLRRQRAPQNIPRDSS